MNKVYLLEYDQNAMIFRNNEFDSENGKFSHTPNGEGFITMSLFEVRKEEDMERVRKFCVEANKLISAVLLDREDAKLPYTKVMEMWAFYHSLPECTWILYMERLKSDKQSIMNNNL